MIKCNIIKSVENVINRCRTVLQSRTANYGFTANGAAKKTSLRPDQKNVERWIKSTVKCEYCRHIDHTVLYMYANQGLKECTYLFHAGYPPVNSVIDDENRLLVSPMGTTCHYFLSRAW